MIASLSTPILRTNQAILAGLLLLLCVLRPASALGCPIRGEKVTLNEVSIWPKRARPFMVSLQGMSVTADLPQSSFRSLSLEVQGAVSFQATAKDVWLTVTALFVSADGMVKVLPGAHFVAQSANGDDAFGTLVMTAGDVLEGENKTPEESLSSMRLPCSGLSLDWTTEEVPSDDAPVPAEARWWKPRGGRERIALRAQPRGSSTVRWLLSPGCSGCLELRQLEERDGWVRIERIGEQVIVTGWVRRFDLEQLPQGEGGGRGAVCTGDHGRPLELGGLAAQEPLPELYEGPVKLKAATRIFAQPGRGEWATVSSDETFEIRFVRGDAWAEITHLEGISGARGSAYVPIDAVVLPVK